MHCLLWLMSIPLSIRCGRQRRGLESSGPPTSYSARSVRGDDQSAPEQQDWYLTAMTGPECYRELILVMCWPAADWSARALAREMFDQRRHQSLRRA